MTLTTAQQQGFPGLWDQGDTSVSLTVVAIFTGEVWTVSGLLLPLCYTPSPPMVLPESGGDRSSLSRKLL